MTQSSSTGSPHDPDRADDPDSTAISGVPAQPERQPAPGVGDPSDPDATVVGAASSALPPEDPDQTFVSVREPVLPWPEPDLPEDTMPPAAQPRGRGWGSGGERPRRRRTGLWIGLSAGLVVVLVAVGVVVVRALDRGTYGPQHTVTDYLDALKDGDAKAALGLWQPSVKTGEDVLLDPDVYSAAKNRPSAYTVKDTHVDGDTATVEVSVTRNGKSHPATFTLERGGKRGLFFSEWNVTKGPEQHITVRDPSSTVEVNGVGVDLSDAAGSTASLAVLPGDYTVVAPSTRKNVVYVDTTVSVETGMAGAGEDDVTVAFPSSAARTAIDSGAAPGAGGQRPANAGKATSVTDGTALVVAPSGNIGCDLGGNDSGCGVLSYRTDSSGPGGEAGRWWFDLNGSVPQARAKSGKAGFEASGASPQSVAYGQAVYQGDKVCVSAKTGMTCWNTSTGHGVYVSRAAFRTF